jgi:hypothetical protein
VSGSLTVLWAITLSGSVKVVVAGGAWSISIPESGKLSASLFGIMTISGWGSLNSQGHFDLHFAGGVGLPQYGAGTGVQGDIWLNASFNGTTFHFNAGGSFSAKFADIELLGVSTSLDVYGSLGQSVSLDLHVSGSGWVWDTIMTVVRMTADAAAAAGYAILNWLGSIGCEILSWFGPARSGWRWRCPAWPGWRSCSPSTSTWPPSSCPPPWPSPRRRRPTWPP